MKKSLPEIPVDFPPYHRVTIFIEYIQYLYENLPETSQLIDNDSMSEVHNVFRNSYIQIMNTFADSRIMHFNSDNDNFYDAMPLKELYIVSHRYNESIVDFDVYKKDWASRSARIDQILSDLE